MRFLNGLFYCENNLVLDFVGGLEIWAISGSDMEADHSPGKIPFNAAASGCCGSILKLSLESVAIKQESGLLAQAAVPRCLRS